MVLKVIELLIVLVLAVAAVFLLYRHLKTQSSPNQQKFLQGKVPTVMPDGLYHGVVTGYSFPWQGKKFNRAAQTGINVFKKNGVLSDNYPFKTYVGQGLVDPQLKVIKIDYNLAQNPLWLRFILDEVVETAPDTYLGKLTVRLPLFPVALGYFTLKK